MTDPPPTKQSNDNKDNEKSSSKRVTPPVLPLDWTKLGDTELSSTHIRYPSDVFDISSDPTETYLEIVGTAGQKITNMGKDLHRLCSPNLTHLIFRSHLIKKMEGYSSFKKLELLELYDNSVEALAELDAEPRDDGSRIGDTLKILDMSYNVIRDMNPVKFCPNLVELYLANNKLKAISGLKNLPSLRKIDLGANRIRIMDESELSCLSNLEELWLGKNKIEKIDGLRSLTKLRRLDVQSNRLTSIENLTSQTETLEELFLAHNGIDDEGALLETGLALNFRALETLDLSKNRLTSCRPFGHMTTLTALWVSSNDIATFDDIEPLAGLGTREGACLEEIYLEHNPIDKDTEYRAKLKSMIPSLNQIDADMIGSRYGSAVNSPNEGDVENSLRLEQMRKLQEKAFRRANEEAAQKMEK